jgi:hypothetical protein
LPHYINTMMHVSGNTQGGHYLIWCPISFLCSLYMNQSANYFNSNSSSMQLLKQLMPELSEMCGLKTITLWLNIHFTYLKKCLLFQISIMIK